MLRPFVLGALALAASLAAGCQSSDLTPEDARVVETGKDIVDRGTRPLNAAEIRAYLADATLSHVGSDRIWHVYLGRNGDMAGLSTSRDGAVERNRGTWEVRAEGEAGTVCRQWRNDWGGGRSGCATVYQYGNDFVFVPVGSNEPRGADIRRTRSPGDGYKVL